MNLSYFFYTMLGKGVSEPWLINRRWSGINYSFQYPNPKEQSVFWKPSSLYNPTSAHFILLASCFALANNYLSVSCDPCGALLNKKVTENFPI